ncbi:MAG: hypothetical protein BWX70_01358 [Verrucomicrobia bacterium ADurb.Bin070]|nr:MAG: hypothetical protein BWX70_01358 [Verrucomicrobia bacterium ADurb.Bin070]
MRKDRVGALRPRKPECMRGDLIQQQRRDRGRRLRHGHVVEPPAVGLPGRAGRQPEAEQHGRLAGIGRERDAFTAPSVGGGHTGHGFQHAPIGAVVDRNLNHTGVSALDVAHLPEGQNRHRGTTQVQRHGKTQRRVARVGIEGAGRIAPRQASGMDTLPRKRPAAIRDPVGAAGLARVQKRIIHAGRQRHRALVAFGVQRALRNRQHAVMERRLRRGRDIRERERPGIGFADQQRVAPVEARSLRAVDPVSGDRHGRARFPRQRHRAHALRRDIRQHRRGRRLADQHVVEIPAVHHNRGIRRQCETEPHIGLSGERREVDLFTCPRRARPRIGRKTDPCETGID